MAEAGGVPVCLSKLVEDSIVEEAAVLYRDTGSVLRNTRTGKGKGKSKDGCSGLDGVEAVQVQAEEGDIQVLPDIEAMESPVRNSAPSRWNLFMRIVQGIIEKRKISRMVFSSIMILFYARNQQVNDFQTMKGILLNACHITK